MKLDFVKLHGLGNDFVFIEDFSQEIELSEAQVKFLCDRHFGIGADGVILVRPSPKDDCAAYMHYINSDGTLAQMCGNGVRCFAKYLVDQGYVQAAEQRLAVDTLAGSKPILFQTDEDGQLTSATVDMGCPILNPLDIPVIAPTLARSSQDIPYVGELTIPSPWGSFAFTCVSMGNPHAICFIEDFATLPDELFTTPTSRCLQTFDVQRIGAFYESCELFPEKTNVEFAVVNSLGIDMRVYERGCGETLACGTGACATSIAASLAGRSGRKNDVNLRGGTLRIVWDENGHVMMTGAACEVFRGSIVL